MDSRNHGITVLGTTGPRQVICSNSAILQMRKLPARGSCRAGGTFRIPASATKTDQGQNLTPVTPTSGVRDQQESPVLRLHSWGADAHLARGGGAPFSPDRAPAPPGWPWGWKQARLRSCLTGSLLVTKGPRYLLSLSSVCRSLDLSPDCLGWNPSSTTHSSCV